MQYTSVCFDLSQIDRQNWFKFWRVKLDIIENDLKGNKNCFELAGGQSYWGFELPIVFFYMYEGNPAGEILIWPELARVLVSNGSS